MDNNYSAESRVIERPSLRRRITLYLILAFLDIGFNAAGGAVAAAVGAHLNSKSNSKTAHDEYHLPHVLGLGALGGLLKSGILALVGFGREFGGINLGMWLLLALVTTTFGMCVLITSAVCSLALGTVPSGLLIAAVVTAIPMSGEMVGVQISPDSHALGITLLGFDALAGYVFARMAHNEGFDICDYNSAAAAGAVYGTMTFVKGMIVSCIKGPTSVEKVTDSNGSVTTTRNRFGTYTVHDPLGRADGYAMVSL